MTVPTLINNNQKQQFVVGLKKAYATLTNAMQMIPITEGCSSGDFECAGWNDSNNIDGQNFNGDTTKKQIYLLSKQIKHSELCYEAEGCERVRKLYQPTNLSDFSSDNIFVASDGMIWGFHWNNWIRVDVNGTKGPNKYGRDIFEFNTALYTPDHKLINVGRVYPLGIDPADGNHTVSGYSGHNNCTTETANAGNWGYPATCTAKVLEEGKMDY